MSRAAGGPEVWEYADYRKFLGDYLEFQRRTTRGFSMRQFCVAKAGISTENYLMRVLRGQRNLGPRNAERFIEAMRLKAAEAEYFRLLVRAGNEASLAVKAPLLDQLERQRRRRRKSVPVIDNGLFRHWYVTAIWELSTCAGFVNDPTWVAKQLRPRISSAQAREALAALTERGLLGRGDVALATTDAVVDSIVKLNHRETLQAAIDAIETPLAERGFFGLTLAFPRAEVPAVKERIKRFLADLQAEYAQSTTADAVYRVQTQCYPMTEKIAAGAAGVEVDAVIGAESRGMEIAAPTQ